MGSRRTFAEELDEASKRLGGEVFQSEVDRVHNEAVRDPHHAFRDVDIPKPDTWKHKNLFGDFMI